jgi:tRNA-dihydrouridine synthase 3
MSRQHAPELSPNECTYQNCRFEHDLRKYLTKGKREDLQTFEKCPVWVARGKCSVGWKCRFVGSHSTERTLEDDRKELVLIEEARNDTKYDGTHEEDGQYGVVNIITAKAKIDLRKKITKTPKADQYTDFLNKMAQDTSAGADKTEKDAEKKDNRAKYIEPPFFASEKRRLYYGPETPVLAPLTTQGNLPFRRLCVSLGAQVTWSEMALGLPLVQGEKPEWALMKAHELELLPPVYRPSTPLSNYDNSKDIRFGAQIAANKPWLALKTAEVLTTHLPHLRAIDLNAGCPIDLVYRQGAGSALLDKPAQLEKILRGMNAVSNEVPITVKIRMGTKDKYPTSEKLVERLAFGGGESQDLGLGPCGVAAITLHGRSRQQRYTRSADWGYIASCSAIIKRYREQAAELTDTNRAPDARDLSPTPLYFMGNGDCYSHVDYYDNIAASSVDSTMIGRGALIKPWLFEEIESKQYLDKSATERLEYVKQFCKYGLEAWGSDEMGVGTTRRFLLEWLSFSHRYVPIGLLEYLPPSIQDRPPRYKARNELETLLASENYKDWIKISEMFLGPAAAGFKFEPKHKSNSYEIEAEG